MIPIQTSLTQLLGKEPSYDDKYSNDTATLRYPDTDHRCGNGRR